MGKIQSEEFVLLYQNNLDDIRDFKDKAWKTAHYSVLGQAAVFALSQLRSNSLEGWMIIGLSFLVLVWGVCLVNHLQGQIYSRQAGLDKLEKVKQEEDFNKSFGEVLDLTKTGNNPKPVWYEVRKRWGFHWQIGISYAVALAVPFAVVVLLTKP